MVSNNRRSRSVTRALAVLSAIAAHGEPVGVSEIARRTDLPKSTVHLALQTMREVGFVEQELSSDRYVLGLAAAHLGAAAQDQSRLLAAMAPAMKQLATRSREAVSLGVRAGHDVLFVKRFETSHVLRTSIHEGSRMPLHASASGKCLLAGMADDDVLALYPTDPLPAQASRTIRTRAELMDEIEAVRRRGHATNHDEFLDGVTGTAVPVRFGDRTVGALSLAGPTGRVGPGDWVDDLHAITNLSATSIADADHTSPTAPPTKEHLP